MQALHRQRAGRLAEPAAGPHTLTATNTSFLARSSTLAVKSTRRQALRRQRASRVAEPTADPYILPLFLEPYL